jgi:hypothetical protein
MIWSWIIYIKDKIAYQSVLSKASTSTARLGDLLDRKVHKSEAVKNSIWA